MLKTILWLGLLFSLAGLLSSGQELWLARRSNALIDALQSNPGAEVPDGASPAVLLAKAQALVRSGHSEEALDFFARADRPGTPDLRHQVRYALGNLYLAQAIEKIEAAQAQQAVPLIQLAKDFYREALRLDSGFWDAKYNLELAMRLLPDLERMDLSRDDTRKQAEPLWTEVPGFPKGLP